jgi:hypothetical protein
VSKNTGKKGRQAEVFDAVIGNPPYNTPRSDANNFTKDLYLDFIHCGATLSDNVTMVTPSRWFAKNSGGNKQLREKMIHEYGLKEIVTVDSKETFGIKIEGGVSYFVLKRGSKVKMSSK